MHLGELKAKPIEELIGIAENMGIENIARSKKARRNIQYFKISFKKWRRH